MTSSGLPTARHHFPTGTDGETCIDYNRACKAARTAAVLIRDGHTDGDQVTHADMDAAADLADVARPNSDTTRHAIRAALNEPITFDDGNQDIAERLFWAAGDGHPLPVRTTDGRLVLLVPIPVGE